MLRNISKKSHVRNLGIEKACSVSKGYTGTVVDGQKSHTASDSSSHPASIHTRIYVSVYVLRKLLSAGR
jgi:hypothetical protein